ncbi:FAD-dependent oxidoreductase [Massilia sp.]|uniref:FAD-dependent oxidoreductase n=1 Tax=Massilia sp. TaxID=1882437 RepID=UPI003919413B
MAVMLIGKQHKALVAWLDQDWWKDDVSPLCILQGFPGAGKTHVSEVLEQRVRARTVPTKIVRCRLPPTSANALDELLLSIASALDDQGDSRLADNCTLETLERLLKEPMLLVVDEFQDTLDNRTGQPPASLAQWFEKVCGTRTMSGRILLLSSHQIDHARWNERCVLRALRGMDVPSGLQFLEHHLAEYGVPAKDLPLERRPDVVEWLGGFPRALKLFASLLRNLPFEEVIGAMPESWETRNQPISERLLKGIEDEMVAQARRGLAEVVDRFFERLAVYRLPVDESGLKAVNEGFGPIDTLKEDLLSRYLLERRQNTYTLHPVLRAAVLRPIKPNVLARAHSLAGKHYARHFRARRLTGSYMRLGREFIELRYHYTQAGQAELIKEFVAPFAAHIRSDLGWHKPLPERVEERDEQIAVLSALSESVDDKLLHFQLARLFDKRGKPQDPERALRHAKQSCRYDSPPAAWALRQRLVERQHGAKAAIKDFRQFALKHVAPDKGLWSLYKLGAGMLMQAGLLPEAETLVADGIAHIEAKSNVSQLYMAQSDIMLRTGRPSEALALLKAGIARVGPKYGGFNLAERAVVIAAHGSTLHPLQEIIELLQAEGAYAPQIELAHVYIAVCRNQFEQAIASPVAQQHASSVMSLAVTFAFCYLSLGQVDAAKATLDRFRTTEGNKLILTPKHSVTWLASWIHLESGDQALANALLSTFLDRPLGDGERTDRATLLRLWDEHGEQDGGRPPARDFPVLAPLLTGLPDYVRRSPWGESILKLRLQGSVAPSASLPEAPPPDAPAHELDTPSPTCTGSSASEDVPGGALRDAVGDTAGTADVPWNSDHIISSMEPAEFRGVYLLGSFDHRITFYTQQVRALNLVRALFEKGKLCSGQSVCVVGAGAAGVMTAVAAARAGCRVTLFDDREAILSLQAPAQHRFLHPHIYDWPAAGSDRIDAGLPVLNWQAANANAVVDSLRTEFERYRAMFGDRLRFVPKTNIQEIRPETKGTRLRVLGNDADINECFDGVFLALGFGLERSAFAAAGTHSYWTGDSLNGPFALGTRQRILVSGSGDGGLVDVARAAMRSHVNGSYFVHHEAVAFLTTDESFCKLAEQMSQVDDEARKAEVTGVEPEPLYQSYKALEVPDTLLAKIRQLARTDTEVTFNFTDHNIFSLNSALLNRLLVFLLLRAQIVERKHGKITNVHISPHNPARKVVEFRNRPENNLEYDMVVLRHGPPRDFVAQRFAELEPAFASLRGALPKLALSQHLAADTAAWHLVRS